MRYAYLVLLFVVISAVSVLGFRGSSTTRPPLEVFPDMDRQAKYKPQAESAFFGDKRTDRPAPVGAVPFGRTAIKAEAKFLGADDQLYQGLASDGTFARGFPASITVDGKLLERGQLKYTIYCAPCHGAIGDGNGITKQYGMGATPTYHDDRLRNMPEGEIFNTITKGKNNMLSYADKLDPDDRWAVIAYVRALQRAQSGTALDIPSAHKSELGLK
ncbi:cytochrome C [Verrucomicrobia bacterium IMCC26134]|jgi:mono/diheme cytochrome c family protein|nr:cytochrome C [Verrucomicrobia bacterium IMCC26134]